MNSLPDIAQRLQGYDPDALSVAQAKAFLALLVQPVAQTEDCPLRGALNRVLAHDVISPIDVPPHDNSAMDGYAFDSTRRIFNKPFELIVQGTSLAGPAWSGVLCDDSCIQIMTGAVMPAGADTVVPKELVKRFRDATGRDCVRIPGDALQAGDNRRQRAEDVARGSVTLSKGELITPAGLGLLASLGVSTVNVRRRLRVAFFSTGNEILSLGDAPRDGAVFDSNRYTILGLLSALGCDMLDLGVVRDEVGQLQAAFKKAAEWADAVITSGGVSVGEADHTKAVMKTLGDVAFWRIAMRPGRPFALGRLGHCVLFGLPGNPVAVMVTFLALVRPALLQMMGRSVNTPPMLQACSTHAIRKKPGRTEYQRAVVSMSAQGQLQVAITGNQGSGVLSSMVQANGLMVLAHDQGDVAPGDRVEVMMFAGAMGP